MITEKGSRTLATSRTGASEEPYFGSDRLLSSTRPAAIHGNVTIIMLRG